MSSLPRWVMRELGWRFVIHEFIFREAAEYVADSTRCSGLLLEFLEYLHRENRCCYLDKSVDGESVLERRYFAILDSLSNKQKFIKEIFNKLVRKGIFISLPCRSLSSSELAVTRKLKLSDEDCIYIRLTLTNNDNILVCVSCLSCPFNLNQERRTLNLNCRELCRR